MVVDLAFSEAKVEREVLPPGGRTMEGGNMPGQGKGASSGNGNGVPIESILSRSVDQIRFHDFELQRRGYDPGAVRDFLAQVAAWMSALQKHVRKLEGDLSDLRAQAEEPAGAAVASAETASDPYEQVASRAATVLRAADEYAEEVRARAEDEALARLAEAGTRADEGLAQAKDQAERLVADAERRASNLRSGSEEVMARAKEAAEALVSQAQETADGMLADARPRRDAILADLRSVHEHILRLGDEISLRLDELSDETEGGGERSTSGGGRGNGAPAGYEDLTILDNDILVLPDLTFPDEHGEPRRQAH
jgi:DivIVA domain-containing protein